MTAVKSLNVTADTYRHRGWLWRNRGMYEVFKAHMKLPLWVDRILTDNSGANLYVVGKEDGKGNASRVGCFHLSLDRGCIPDTQPERSQYNCNMGPGNGFVVVAERIRAKKPDASKVPRPLWRQPMTKPWEPGTLKGKWVLDSKLVKEVKLNVVVPERADRLYISTSDGTDALVWVDSTTLKPHEGCADIKEAWAQGANGIKGHQHTNDYGHDKVRLHAGCHWQLAGVRKKTPQVPVAAPDHLGALAAEMASIASAAGRPFCNMWAPKPPIGVQPRNLHDERRANALDEAMVRYLDEDLPFPIEWAIEWNELRARLNKEQSDGPEPTYATRAGSLAAGKHQRTCGRWCCP